MAEQWAFADVQLRTFLALNSKGTAYHYVHPATADDRRVKDGLVATGMLVCECEGGRYRGNCYQTAKAEQALRAAGQSAVADWIETPEAAEAEA